MYVIKINKKFMRLVYTGNRYKKPASKVKFELLK